MPALLLWAVACAAPSSAYAGRLSVSLLGQHSHYGVTERFPSGAIADEEQGRPDGGEIQVHWTRTAGTRWMLRGQRWRRLIAYEGRNQIGLPISTSTDLAWTDVAGAGEWDLREGSGWTLTAGTALGRRTIVRAIAPTFFSTPLTERLNTAYAQASLGFRLHPLPAWTVSARWGVEQALYTRLHVDFHGLADPVTVSPARRTSQRYEWSLEKDLSPNARGVIAWRREELRFGESGDAPYTVQGQGSGGRVRYPGSAQRLDAWMLGLTLFWR